MTESQGLIHMIRHILVPDSACCRIQVTDWEAVIKTAAKHGVCQYVYRCIKQLWDDVLPPEIATAAEKRSALELRSSILQEHAMDKLREALAQAGVDFLFMKGAVTKERYPDKSLRSMGDIDFLYRPEQHALLCRTMKEQGFVQKRIGRVHDMYTGPGGVLLEAHRQMMSPSSPYKAFGEDIWQRVKPRKTGCHEYAMGIEDEFLFNFLHLAKHFKSGGIGIRFIVDIWIYKGWEMDREYVRRQLEAFGLLTFYDAVDALAEKWFGGKADTDSLMGEMEQFVLSGGVFGNASHQRSAAIRKGRARSFFRACFPNYAEMRSMFPWLNTRLLLPFAWLWRILDSLIRRRGNIRILLNPVFRGDTDAAQELKRFLSRCGLE